VTTGEICFRPLSRPDFALLSTWLAAPHVEAWWREEYEPAAVELRYGPGVDGAEAIEYFVTELDGEPIGLVQRYRLADEPEWRRSLAVAQVPDDAAGIDYLIGDEGRIGRGLGPVVIDRFVADIWTRWPDVSAVVADVSQANRRSWRSLEKAGFSRTWSGTLDSTDPSDVGPSYVYVQYRPRA